MELTVDMEGPGHRTVKEVSERTCVACKRTDSASDLLRVVASPGGDVTPDWNRKLGGRGSHVCLHQKCIRSAFEKKLFDKTLRRSLRYPELNVFLSVLEMHMVRALTVYLATAVRKGSVVTGTDAVIAKLQKNKVTFLIVAADMAGRADFVQRANEIGLPHAEWGTKELVGDMTGRRPTGVVGITDATLAGAFNRLFRQWEAFHTAIPANAK